MSSSFYNKAKCKNIFKDLILSCKESANSGIKLSIDELAKHSNYIDLMDISTQINSGI